MCCLLPLFTAFAQLPTWMVKIISIERTYQTINHLICQSAPATMPSICAHYIIIVITHKHVDDGNNEMESCLQCCRRRLETTRGLRRRLIGVNSIRYRKDKCVCLWMWSKGVKWRALIFRGGTTSVPLSRCAGVNWDTFLAYFCR
jgi:hypothetical protein